MINEYKKKIIFLFLVLCMAMLPGGSKVEASSMPPTPENIIIETGETRTEQIVNDNDNFTLLLEQESMLAVTGEESSVEISGAKGDVVLSRDSAISLSVEEGVAAYIEGSAVEFEYSDLATLSLDNGSSISATGSGIENIHINGAAFRYVGSSEISLDNNSYITSMAVNTNTDSEDRFDAEAIGVLSSRADDSHMFLDHGSRVMADAANEYGNAIATGINMGDIVMEATAELILDNASRVEATASGFQAASTGLIIANSAHGVVEMNNGSSILSSADGSGSSESFGLQISNVGNAKVSLDYNSSITAMAIGRITDDSEWTMVRAVGILTNSADDFHVALNHDSRILADAVVEYGFAVAIGIEMREVSMPLTAEVILDNASRVEATAKGFQAGSLGLIIANSAHGVVEMNDGSSILSSADGSGDSQSFGLEISNVGNAEVSLDNQSWIKSSAVSKEGGSAISAGVIMACEESYITLDNGSGIIADSIESYGIHISGGTSEISLDKTSSVTGDWAVWSEDSSVILNNSGLINGRLGVTTLKNTSTGRLFATLGSDSDSRVTGSLDESTAYFNVSGTSSLADGSTIMLSSGDNFGLENIGDISKYYVMKAGTGEWTQNEINLKTASPMLGLSWSDDSDAENLVVAATMKNPSEAGLTPNGGIVAKAALDAGLFDFDSSPEEWAPNANGAFLMGVINSVNSMQTGVSNRLNGLSGVSSGDEAMVEQGLWLEMIYTDASQKDRDGVRGFDADTRNMIFGYDRQYGPAVLGVAMTLGETDAEGNSGLENHDVNDTLFTIYGSYDFGSWFTEAGISLGRGEIDTLRRAGSQTLAASYDSDVYSGMVSAGYNLNVGGFKVVPVVSLNYSHKEYDSYQETGGNKALLVDAQKYEMLNIGAGIKAEHSWNKYWGTLTSELTSMLYYDVVGDRFTSYARFAGDAGATPFVTLGPEPLQTSWQISAGVTLAGHESNYSLRLSCDYMGREDFNATSTSIKLRYEF